MMTQSPPMAIPGQPTPGSWLSTKSKIRHQGEYSLVPNVTHRSIETHACTLGKSIGLNYPHAWTNGKLLCGKKYTTNNFVSHNPIETHDFKISSCQKCDFQLNHTSDFHFQIGMIQIKHTPVFGFGLILIKHGYLLRLYMGLLNHMCQINNTCVTFGTRE